MSCLRVFFGKTLLWLVWQKGKFILVGKKVHLYRTYRKHRISMYFLRNTIFHFPSVEKISYFQEKEMPSFLMIEKISYSRAIFWKDHIFRTFEYIIFPQIFLRKIIFYFPLKNKIIFSGKRNVIFTDDTRNIIFQCDFLERSSFQNIWKIKICSLVQWCIDW